MDSMSYRNSRPPQRSSAPESREEPPKSAKEQVATETAAHPAGTRRAASTKNAPVRRKKPVLLVGSLLIATAIVTAVIMFFANQGGSAGDMAIDSKKYQAIFLRNGQIYFGKLTPVSRDYFKLNDVFYLQTQSTSEDGTADSQADATNSQGDVQLIKLGNEVHGPDDEMIVNRDEVMYYENLKADGKVSQAIEKYSSNN